MNISNLTTATVKNVMPNVSNNYKELAEKNINLFMGIGKIPGQHKTQLDTPVTP